MIELAEVSLRRGGRMLFDGLSLQLPDPGIYLFHGPPASGKTLLGRLLTGRLRPDSGSVSLDGTSIYLRPRSYREPLFYAASTDPMDLPEGTLGECLESEAWRGNGGRLTLAPHVDMLEEALTGAREREIASLSSAELALAQVALACAVQTRIAVLDGQLDRFDERLGRLAARMLRQAAQAADRFLILTALGPGADLTLPLKRIALAGGMPAGIIPA